MEVDCMDEVSIIKEKEEQRQFTQSNNTESVGNVNKQCK